jgi:hypothetical protein
MALSSCGQAPLAPELESFQGRLDARAVQVCSKLFSGLPESAFVGAVDYTMGGVRDLQLSLDIDPEKDPNHEGPDSTYAAICVLAEEESGQAGINEVLYQMEDPSRSGVLGSITLSQ